MPKFYSIPLLLSNPITKPPTILQPRRTVERPLKKRLYRTRGNTDKSRPYQGQIISLEPTSGQSSEDYPIIDKRAIVKETPLPIQTILLPTPLPILPRVFLVPILQLSIRRISRSIASKLAKRYNSEDYSKYGVRKSSVAINNRQEDNIGKTGLYFVSTELRIKAYTIPIPTSYKATIASDYANKQYKAIETQISKITDA